MTELTPEARAVVDAARDVTLRSSADRARVREALRARIATEALSGSAPAVAPRSVRAALGRKTRWIAGTATVALVALGLLALRARASHAPAAAPTRSPPREARVTLDVRPSSGPAATQSPAAPTSPSAVRATAVAIAATRVEEETPAGALRGATSRARLERQPESSLAIELALLRGVRDALRRGDTPGASTLLAQHAHRFPHGALREERLAEQTILACRGASADDASRHAAVFRREFARSIHAERVARACGSLEPPPAVDR